MSQKYWIQIFRKKHIHVIVEKFEKEYLGPISEEVKILFETMLVNIVTFHDFGKVNPIFQKKKMKHEFHLELAPDNNIGSKHSILSSVFYLDYFLGKINELEDKVERDLLKDFAYINSYIISRHHGKLVDLKQYLESLSGRDTEGEDLGIRARAWLEKWKKEVMGDDNVSKFRNRWERMLERNGGEENRKKVYLYGLTRLLYSMLIASDYYATSEYMKGVEIQNFGEIEQYDEIINIYEQSPVQKSIRSYEETYYPIVRQEMLILFLLSVHLLEMKTSDLEIFLEYQWNESMVKKKEGQKTWYYPDFVEPGNIEWKRILQVLLQEMDGENFRKEYVVPRIKGFLSAYEKKENMVMCLLKDIEWEMEVDDSDWICGGSYLLPDAMILAENLKIASMEEVEEELQKKGIHSLTKRSAICKKEKECVTVFLWQEENEKYLRDTGVYSALEHYLQRLKEYIEGEL